MRIGVFVCWCGSNIAKTVDVAAVAEAAKHFPGVVYATDYKYMCSEPGQNMIAEAIKEHRLDRVVVASCSPRLHEPTFQRCIESAGLNPYMVEMANIREQCSWVHEKTPETTEKAIELTRMAVAKVAKNYPLFRNDIAITKRALVIGGGIAGIQAALDIADAGYPVVLVERTPSIGGHMAQYDKTFPTLDCAACILTPKMSAVKAHPNITLWTYSEVVSVDGSVGDYKVVVKRKPRYVREDLCVGCLQCIDTCVFKEPKFDDEFNMGLSKRKPIYIPFPQATPKVVVIDPEACIQLKTGKCKKSCLEACVERGAIDFDQKETYEEIHVGSIIIATGFQTFDPRRMPQYGYGKYPNVYTTLEVERLVNASGPTGGQVVTRDGRVPKSVGIILCVGSRDENTNRWCSRVCCMTSLKLAHLIKEHTGAEVFIFYIDMRAAGKGYEEFYQRVLNEGVHFVRGRVAEITDWALDPSEEGKLVARVEDTNTGFVRRIPLDMVVLAVGLEPQPDALNVQRLFGIGCSMDGFFLEKHPKLAPAPTYTDGIFIAGVCHGPKDIPDTVMQAGYAAAEAIALADTGYFELEPNTAYIVEEECSGCKSCIPLCPYQAISFNEEKKKAFINEVLCKGCGTCVAACPSGSIKQNLFEDEEIFSEIEGVLAYA